MNDSNNGHASRDATPDYAEMADNLEAIAAELLEEGRAHGAQDMIEKANRLMKLAVQMRPNSDS